ncbi:hypothetical protein EVC13_034 [Rhizobium phage RHph_I65]|nr:hypothetical protein EVC13_034 [Rhizobium phage RHph_I65]
MGKKNAGALAFGSPSFRIGAGGRLRLGTGAVSPWYDPNALEVDFINGRFAKNGVVYADQAAFLLGLKGSDSAAAAGVTSGRLTVGNYVSPGITEELIDPTFSTGTPWVPRQSSGGPATASIVSDVLRLQGNGAVNPGVDQKINPLKSKAYRLTGTVGRGTSGVGNQLGVGSSPGFGTPIAQSPLTPSTNTYTHNFSTVGSAAAPDTYIGMKSSGTVAGSNYSTADNFSCKECWPFEGFQPGFVSGRIRFRSCADGVGTYNLLQFDNNAVNGTTAIENSWIRIREVAGVMQLVIVYETAAGTATTQTIMSLGAVEPSTDHYIDFGVAPGFAAASMDGGAPTNFLLGNMPGIAYMRMHYGRLTTGNLWDNTNTWLTLYNNLIYPAGANPASFVNYGDSYGRIGGYVRTATGLILRDKSSGGLELQAIYDIVLANPSTYGKPTVFWDGKPNGNPSGTTDYLNMIEAIGNLIGWSNFAISGPVKTIIGSGENAGIDARRSGIQALCATHGGYYIDGQAILAAHGDGSAGDNAAIAGGVCPPSLLEPDGVHINATGNGWVAGNSTAAGTFAKALKDMGAY